MNPNHSELFVFVDGLAKAIPEAKRVPACLKRMAEKIAARHGRHSGMQPEDAVALLVTKLLDAAKRDRLRGKEPLGDLRALGPEALAAALRVRMRQAVLDSCDRREGRSLREHVNAALRSELPSDPVDPSSLYVGAKLSSEQVRHAVAIVVAKEGRGSVESMTREVRRLYLTFGTKAGEEAVESHRSSDDQLDAKAVEVAVARNLSINEQRLLAASATRSMKELSADRASDYMKLWRQVRDLKERVRTIIRPLDVSHEATAIGLAMAWSAC